jgi:hypothetical protein
LKFQDPAPACWTRHDELVQVAAHLPALVQSTTQVEPPLQSTEQLWEARQLT